MLKELKKKINLKQKEMQKTISDRFGIDVTPSITYNLKRQRTLGMYDPQTDEILLNKELLLEFGELYIEDVFVHEFCHAVIKKQYPWGINTITHKKVTAHGKDFKFICSLFGNNGKATTGAFANSEVLKTNKKTKRKISRYLHACECREHSISAIKHNRILEGINYICKKCKTKLQVDSVLITN
jgi:SprT protein